MLAIILIFKYHPPHLWVGKPGAAAGKSRKWELKQAESNSQRYVASPQRENCVMMAMRVSLWLLLRILANVIHNKSKTSITFLYKFRVSAPKFILPSGKATSLFFGLQEINEILISVCKARQCTRKIFPRFCFKSQRRKSGKFNCEFKTNKYDKES